MAYNVSQASVLAKRLSETKDEYELRKAVAFDCYDFHTAHILGIKDRDIYYGKIVNLIANCMQLVYKMGYSNKILNGSIRHVLEEEYVDDGNAEESSKRASR